MFTTVTSHFQQLTAKHPVMLFTVFCLCASAFGFGVRARSSAIPEKKQAIARHDSNAGLAPIQTQPSNNIEAELITLRNFGFEPAALKRPAGEVLFVINNRSRWQDLVPTLNRVQGNKVKDVGLRKGQVNWFEKFNLPPGDYVLTATGHPELSCAITLTPR